MTWPLTFREERDRDTDSWARANPDRALIEHVSRYTYLVTLPGGQTHRVAYAIEDDVRTGRCDCKGWEYRNRRTSPCAHLCTLRQAEFIDATTTRGRHVRPEEVTLEFEPATTTGDRARADGGRVDRDSIDELPTRCSGR